MFRFMATCLHCGAKRKVAKPELDRARQPHCLKCGGPLELSGAAKEKLKEVQSAKKEQEVPPKGGRRRKKPAEEPAPRILPRHEAGSYQFHAFGTLYETLIGDPERGLREQLLAEGPLEFYRKRREGHARRQPNPFATEEEVGLNHCADCLHEAEEKLYQAGKPYYKIWPAIASQLCDTEMRIPGQFFRLPFPGMEIRLPTRDNPLEPARACVVARLEGNAWLDGRDWGLVVAFMDGEPEAKGTRIWLADIPIRPTLLLEDALDQTSLVQQCPDPALARRLVRVCVGVCFFGVDNHEAILPDLPRAVIDRYQREGRTPSGSVAKKHLKEARKAGLFGWKVGSEIDLPRPVIQHHPAGEGQGEHRELTAGHVRRGHMRMQAHGEKLSQRKLIFVPPTLVRPDLPLASTHGYRVRLPRGTTLTPREDS